MWQSCCWALSGSSVKVVSSPQVLFMWTFCYLGLLIVWQLDLRVSTTSGKKWKLPVFSWLGPELGSVSLVQFYWSKEPQSFYYWFKKKRHKSHFSVEAMSKYLFSSVQSLSHVQLFGDRMLCSMPGFHVHHQLLELASKVLVAIFNTPQVGKKRLLQKYD